MILFILILVCFLRIIVCFLLIMVWRLTWLPFSWIHPLLCMYVWCDLMQLNQKSRYLLIAKTHENYLFYKDIQMRVDNYADSLTLLILQLLSRLWFEKSFNANIFPVRTQYVDSTSTRRRSNVMDVILTSIRRRSNVMDVVWTLEQHCVQGTVNIMRAGTSGTLWVYMSMLWGKDVHDLPRITP